MECCKHYISSPFSERSAAARGVGKFVPNHVNIVSLDLFIHTPLINLEDRELCYFPNKWILIIILFIILSISRVMMLENFICELNLGCYFVHKEMFVYKFI